jgi:hypothetical protein
MVTPKLLYVMTLMVALASFIGLLLISISQFALAQDPTSNSGNPVIFPPDSQPYGLNYGEWTAKWWQWAHSIPTERNPQLDDTGEDCAQAQNQTGPIWFLAGTSGGSVDRTCTIPAGKAILFPIVNTINIRAASETDEELLAVAKNMANSVTTLEASIDGVPLQNLSNYRIQSPFFNVNLPSDNIFGISGGSYRAVADGYWVFLEPLPPGQHEIRFHGAMVDPTAASTLNFETAVTYHLIVSDTAISPTSEQDTNATTTSSTVLTYQ